MAATENDQTPVRVRPYPNRDGGPAAYGHQEEGEPLVEFYGEQNPISIVEGVQQVLTHIQADLKEFDEDPAHADLKPEALAKLREAYEQEVVSRYDLFFTEVYDHSVDQAEHAQALLNRAQFPMRYSGNLMHQQRAATEISMAMTQPLQGNLPTVELDQALRAKNIDLASALIQRARTLKIEVPPSERARFDKAVEKYREMLDLGTVEENLANAEQTLEAVKASRAAIASHGNDPQQLIALGLAGLPRTTEGYLKANAANPFK